ncbi:MAG: hypothetical protein Q4G68_14080 [Planctomycetia bacterium]|nr:hypothetical protein [Planctomycetia bacterium]
MNVVRYCVYFALLIVPMVTGCGDANRASLSGTVTVNGTPIENGSISFTPLQGTTSSAAGAAIKDGVYKIPNDKGPLPGEFKVIITGTKKSGKKIKEPGTGNELDEVVSAIPAKYDPLRGGTEVLKATITTGGNKLDFDLTE